MRRWLRRIVYGLLIAIAVLAIAIQVVLWTDYPRRLVLTLVQRELGLRVEARALSTGWFGSTTLSDVKLSLPLANESFLDMPTMNVRHTWLLPLIVTQNFELHAIDLEKPNLVVRRDAGGRWNVQDVAELVAKATAGTPEPGTKKRPPKLPRLKLVDGTIAIIERDGRRATIAPVNVSGYPDGLLVYRYDGTVPGADAKPLVKLVGEIAPGEDFKHQFTLFARPPQEWLAPWTASPPQPLEINAQWTGVINDNVLTGRLEVQDAKFKTFASRGRVALVTGGDGPTIINPQKVVVTTLIDGLPQVQLTSGTLRLEGTTLRMQQLRVTAMGGDAQLDGSADLAGKSASISGAWQDLAAGAAGMRHGGNLAISVKTPFADRPEIAATITSHGHVPKRGDWDGQLRIEGAGRSWTDIDWLVTLPRLAWNGRAPFSVADVSARVAQREKTLTLTQLRWPAAEQLTARGDVNLVDHSWRLRLSGRGAMNQTPPAPPSPFDFNFDARGNWDQRERWFNAHLRELLVHSVGTELRISGDYLSQKPAPLELTVALNHLPEDVLGPEIIPIHGRLLSEVKLRGTLDPLNLRATGTVRTHQLVIRNRDFGNITGVVEAAVGAEKTEIFVRDMSMLGGTWQVDGVWPYAGEDKLVDASSEAFRVVIHAKDVQLHEVGDLLGTTLDGGSGNGQFFIDIPVPRPRRDTIAAKGTFDATAIAANGFNADQMTGELLLRDGLLRVEPVTFRRTDRDVRGEATLTIQTTTAAPAKPTVKLSSQTWPVRMSNGDGGGVAAVSADASLSVNAAVKPPTASGPLTARVKFATTQAAIGEASIEGQIDGRVGIFDKITLEGVGGLGGASGHATIDADQPHRTTAVLTWDKVDGVRLADLVPRLAGLTGSYSGQLTIDPATDPRAIEPLRVTVGLTPTDGKFRTVDIGPAKVSAFLNLSPSFVLQRVVLDELPSETRATQAREKELDAKSVPPQERPLAWNDFRLAGGRVRLWARRGRHPSGEIQTHITTDFYRLDVDQLVHAVKSDADPMPWRLGGHLIVHGDPNNLDDVFANGHIDITDSDLAKVDALALLYNLIGLGTSPKQPNGAGSLDLSLQRSTLTLNNVKYFNRGVEAWSSAVTIGDIWHVPKSPIHGYVVGSARPLSALKLPLLADVDQIMSVLQSNLTTVKVEGTLENYKAEPATFGDISDALKTFMRGQVTEETGK